MTTLLTSLLSLSLVALLGSAAAGLAGWAVGPNAGPAPARRWLGGASVIGLVLATGALALAVVVRAVAAGHAPWSNLHEFSVAFAAATGVTYLVLARSWPIGGLAPLVALVTAGLVAFAMALPSEIRPLVPALQQPTLLAVHVGAAVAAYAVAAVAVVAAIGELAQRAAGRRIGRLPDADTCRAVGHRAVLIGFPILTVAIVLGAIWANLAWRSFWSNDPKELAAAATWLVFGAYLHVANRRDRWAALAPWLIVIGFAGVLFTFIGAGLFIVGEHSYGTG